MLKIMFLIFVWFAIFSTAIYNDVLTGIIDMLINAKNNLMPYIPIEIRIPIFIVLLAIFLKLTKSLIWTE